MVEGNPSFPPFPLPSPAHPASPSLQTVRRIEGSIVEGDGIARKKERTVGRGEGGKEDFERIGDSERGNRREKVADVYLWV